MTILTDILDGYDGEANLVNWIEHSLNVTEIVESCVIGDNENRSTNSDIPCGLRMPWKDAKKWLDYDFNDGFGLGDCHAVYVWTNERIFFVREYDGSTRLGWLPRNPTDIVPCYT